MKKKKKIELRDYNLHIYFAEAQLHKTNLYSLHTFTFIIFTFQIHLYLGVHVCHTCFKNIVIVLPFQLSHMQCSFMHVRVGMAIFPRPA